MITLRINRSWVAQAVDSARTTRTPSLKVTGVQCAATSVPTIAGQRLTQESITDTYFRFTFPRVPASPQGYPLAVISEGEQKGVWALRMNVQN